MGNLTQTGLNGSVGLLVGQACGRKGQVVRASRSLGLLHGINVPTGFFDMGGSDRGLGGQFKFG